MADLEELAKARVKARTDFIGHVTMYSVANAALFALWLATGRGYPWFVWPLLVWGIGVLGHALTFAMGPGSNAERRAVDREVRRMRAAQH